MEKLKIKELKTYYCKVCGKPFTMKTERNVSGITYCSAECKHQYLSEHTGGYRKCSGRGKKGWYKGIYCDSSWELAFVIYHLDHKLEISRCNESRKYIYNNEEHSYYPDFITKQGIIEIKGYNTDQWQAKLNKNSDVKVLYKDDMLLYLKYVVDKYGIDFIRLYDNSNPRKLIENKQHIWMHNDIENVYIKPSLYEEYLNKGYIRGRQNNLAKKEHLTKDEVDYNKRKVKERPSYEELLNFKQKYTNDAIGKMFGVTEATIRRWIKYYEKRLIVGLE